MPCMHVRDHKESESRSLSTPHRTVDLTTKLAGCIKGCMRLLICHYGCCIFPGMLFFQSTEGMYSTHTHTGLLTYMGLVCKPSIEGTINRILSLITLAIDPLSSSSCQCLSVRGQCLCSPPVAAYIPR